MTTQELYGYNCKTPSDINELLPTLKEYYDKCESITEIGVRGCVSLSAALASNAKKVIAIDIMNVAIPESDKLTFICGSSLEIEIGLTDMLFIDSLHTYKQLKAELTLHAKNVRKWIGMHDTTFFGLNGEDGGLGLNQSINEFLNENPEWRIKLVKSNNNGLTIISRM